ncbi:MAG: rod shape-determining protein MreC [Gemmatimonadota bacterium]
MLDFDGSKKARRREAAIALGLLVVALTLWLLPAAFQSSVRKAIQGTVLSPFLSAQAVLSGRRASSVDVTEVRAQRDSLVAVVSAQATLSEENRRLRELLRLHARTGPSFIPAEVLQLGIGTAESTFMINVGSEEGVRVNSPVIAAEGLVGKVVEVRDHMSQVMDWTHPDYRASVMTVDGQSMGIAQARHDTDNREQDVLVINGAPFHTDLRPGQLVVTTGRGNIFPRGIPVGIVLAIDEADTGWRKSYLLRPMVRPEVVTSVLVGVGPVDADLSELWGSARAPDTTRVPPRSPGGRPARRDTSTVPITTTGQ